ncbi:ABC transporter permease [Streptomyces oceani]|uniref:ABC3 transporter permease C-terminal domain-containing protein n=1 Tax=Streptomyces oceani TaxID=1075402 RepID=A0A1E7KPG4_9ACTN|nr:ABC transporter permease [Streptomyces oceani]OEV05786.1 hypothetical protein AN216_02275 [Streptomyces oceani]
MFTLALRSLRFRVGAFAASFLSTLLGATVLMSFASMLDTAAGDHVDAASEETLGTMATVVGGWGLLLVVFAVSSTLTLAVRQRAQEMALLKSVGATPAQLRRMVVGEALVVSTSAALLAVAPAMLGGRGLLAVLKETGQVNEEIDYAFGATGLSMGLGITFAAAVLAAFLGARRATAMRARDALTDAQLANPPMGLARRIGAVLLLLVGASQGVVTMTVMNGEGSDAMQTAGTASITFALGLALLAPLLVRTVGAVLTAPLRWFAGTSGYLTAHNVRRRTQQLANALMPVILFTGISFGTLYMQAVENDATDAAGLTKSTEDKNIELLNFVVIGMIALFACIMLINTLVATTTFRTREFGQQRLVGATPGQVLGTVGLEGLVLACSGIGFGSLAGLVTLIPFTIARTDRVVPDVGPAMYGGIVAVALLVTLASCVLTARRSLRTPAMEVVSAA